MAEKVLKLYKKLGNTIKRFPDVEEGQLPLVVTDFTYDAKRMGGAPTIQCTIMYHKCLDDEWSKDVYTEFRGEKYYIKQTPSSTKDNKDARWKHEVTLISERSVLDNIYFFDVVDSKEGVIGHAPVSNSTDFTFFGTIEEFVKRLNESMIYAGVGKSDENTDGYSVEINRNSLSVDDLSLAKAVSFQDKFISEALQEIFNAYDLYYYFEDKTIYVGDKLDATIGTETEPLEYGATKALISVQKSNANYKPINNICGRGSDQNIPYYYPNPHRRGEVKPVISEWGDVGVEIDDEDTFYVKLDSWDRMVGSTVAQEVAITRYEGIYIQNGTIDYDDYNSNNLYDKTFNQNFYTGFVNFSSYANQNGLGEMSVVIKYVFEFNDDSATRKIRAFNIENINNIQISQNNSNITYEKDTTFIQRYGKMYRLKDSERTFIGEAKGDISKEIDAKMSGTYEWYAVYNFSHYIKKHDNNNIEFKTYSGKINIDTALLLRDGSSTNIIKNNKVVGSIITFGNISENPYKEYGMRLTSPNIGIGTNVEISQEFVRWFQPQKNLQTNVYIDSENKERFYPVKKYPIKRGTSTIVPNANIGEYKDSQTEYIENDNYKDENGKYYNFENPYSANNQYQHIIDFPDIMPTIEGVENADGLRIDMFSEFAYDDGDNNFEKEDNENNKEESSGNLRREHPYFFGKLRTMPFNLFDHAIENGEMTVAMTSGNLGSCKFVIHVGEEHQKNIVQVNSDGSLKRDAYGNVVCGRRIYVDGKGWEGQGVQQPQDQQNDTRTNEVWVALAKDTETFTTVMPYAEDGQLTAYKPNEATPNGNDGDTFVLLNIKLPQAYIDAAQDRLTKETIKYLAENNKEKFSFAIDFSRIYLAENPSVLDSLSENSMVYIKHNNNTYKQYISSYSYKMSNKDALPEIKVNLSETLSAQTGALQQVINEVKSQVEYSIGKSSGMGVSLATLDRQYIRRDTQDTTTGNITFLNGIKYGKGKDDGKASAEMQIDDGNNSTLTVDNLIVRNNDERVQKLIERIVSLENKINELTNN